MNKYKGVLEFEYFGELKKISYRFHAYAGTPHFEITDNNGNEHQFHKCVFGWKSIFLVEPKWPKDFLGVLYQTMQNEMELLMNRYPEIRSCIG